MLQQIFKTTLIAGGLDIIAAFMQAYFSKGVNPGIVLKYIASGLVGKDAFTEHTGYTVLGLLIHFFITWICVVVYFFFYPRLHFLQKNLFLSAFLVAVIAWLITNRVIIPLSKIPAPVFNLAGMVTALIILFFCVGIPIALFAKKYYQSKRGY